MTLPLGAVWGVSIIVETGLLVRVWRSLRTPLVSYPWFVAFVLADLLLNVTLFALRIELPKTYYPVWLVSELILTVVQTAMAVEAVRKMHEAKPFPIEDQALALGLAVGLSMMVYLGARGPLRWPDAWLEYACLAKATVYTFLSILLMELAGLCIQPGRRAVLSHPATKHSVLLSVYAAISGAAYFAVGRADFNAALTLGSAACYVCWLWVFRLPSGDRRASPRIQPNAEIEEIPVHRETPHRTRF